MIEYRVSRSDHRYFTWSGKHICSAYDPKKESAEWAKGLSANLDRINNLVILGLGNGYHAVELRKRYPSKSITVFEAIPEFTSPCLDIHGIDFNNIEIVLAESESIFRAQRRLSKLMQGSYYVLSFYPVTQLKPHLYSRFEELLIGRTPESLAFQVSQRKVLQACFKKSSEQDTARLLDIRDLESTLLPNADFTEVHTIRTLRELLI